MTPAIGVLLLTFGSATTEDGVAAYLQSVRGGRPVPDDVLEEFRRRYRVIGRSPLLEVTAEQARLLQQRLDAEAGPDAYRVRAGMLHSEPRADRAFDDLVAAGVGEIVGIVLAPQYSPLILAGYERAAAAARERHPSVEIRLAGAWHETPEWIDSLAERLRDALRACADTTPVIFTAHSLPRPVVERDPAYIDQLRGTARLVAERAHLPESRWTFAYQSAGHTPEEWLRPDVKELLPGYRDTGHREVTVAPVQFLADHLEILYDIDVAAAEEARALGITLRRIAMPNASPALIDALAAVVRREVAARV